VVDDQLAVLAEEIGKRLLSSRCIKDIALLDLFPRKRAAFRGDEVAHAGQRLLVLEMRLAGGDPVFMRNDFVLLHVQLPLIACSRNYAR
jgi:hypothetical protein